jgi:hypothetical protein
MAREMRGAREEAVHEDSTLRAALSMPLSCIAPRWLSFLSTTRIPAQQVEQRT